MCGRTCMFLVGEGVVSPMALKFSLETSGLFRAGTHPCPFLTYVPSRHPQDQNDLIKRVNQDGFRVVNQPKCMDKDNCPYRQSYNVAPSLTQPALRPSLSSASFHSSDLPNKGKNQASDLTVDLTPMKWGLSLATAGKAITNARSDKLASGYWSRLWRNRCIIPIQGFYEWKRQSVGGKETFFHYCRPSFLEGQEGDDPKTLLYAAALYDNVGQSGRPRVSEEVLAEYPTLRYVIVTSEAFPSIAHIHDRMPLLLLTPEARSMWLNGVSNPASMALVASECYRISTLNADILKVVEVSGYVNSTANNGPQCIKPKSISSPSPLPVKSRSSPLTNVKNKRPKGTKAITSYFHTAARSSSSSSPTPKKMKSETL